MTKYVFGTTHHLVHYLVGERNFVLFISYAGGYREGRRAVERTLRLHLNDESLQGVSISDVTGTCDLLIRIWIRPAELESVSFAIKVLPQVRAIDVVKVGRATTPFQRSIDDDLESPLDPMLLLTPNGTRWSVNRAFADEVSIRRPPSAVPFFVVYPCSASRRRKLFDILQNRCASLACQTKSQLHNYSLYCFGGEDRSGVLLSAQAPSWPMAQQVFSTLLAVASDEDQKSESLLCVGAAPWENDHVRASSLAIADAADYKAVFLRGAMTILDLEVPADDQPLVRQLVSEFTEPLARRLLTYDNDWWWDFIEDVHTLTHDLISGQDDRVLAFFMLEYTRIEKTLHDLVIDVFRLHHTEDQSRENDHPILRWCKIFEHEEHAAGLKTAIKLVEGLHSTKKISRVERDSLNRELRYARQYLSSLATGQAHLMLGNIPRALKKLADGKLLPRAWGDIGDVPLMVEWDQNIGLISRDRNELMHGAIQSVYRSTQRGSAPWRQLFRNFVMVYPQYRWLCDCLLPKRTAELYSTTKGSDGSSTKSGVAADHEDL